MKIKDMKVLDELLGPMLCFIFYWYNLFKKIILPRRQSVADQEVKNIVLIKLFGMGSIVLATVMMRALKEKFPKAKVLMLTFSANKEICQRLKLIDEVYTIDSSSIYSFMRDALTNIRKIRLRHCAISIDLEFFAKSSTLIQYLCNTGIRVGYYIIRQGFLFKMLWRGDLLTDNVYFNAHKHADEIFLALARSIGADTKNLNLAPVEIYREDRLRLGELLRNFNFSAKNGYLVMNINAGQLCLERRWPLHNFVTLTRRLFANGVEKVILIGDKNDTQYVQSFTGILNNDQRLINLAGKLDIGMLAALLADAGLFITNDSGPLHIAVSLGVATVSFFGPEMPERFGPRGQKHTVFYSGIYCSPCLNVFNQKTAPCNGENKCMRDIAVEDVFKCITEKHLKSEIYLHE